MILQNSRIIVIAIIIVIHESMMHCFQGITSIKTPSLNTNICSPARTRESLRRRFRCGPSYLGALGGVRKPQQSLTLGPVGGMQDGSVAIQTAGAAWRWGAPRVREPLQEEGKKRTGLARGSFSSEDKGSLEVFSECTVSSCKTDRRGAPPTGEAPPPRRSRQRSLASAGSLRRPDLAPHSWALLSV